MHSRRSEFISGVQAELPIMLGVIPFGMIYGVVAMGAGLPAGVAQAMSSIVFAGSAQFVAAQLFGMGTPGLVIVLTAFVVNLRHMLYSASVAPYVRHLDAKWKCLLAYLLTDEAYAVVITRYNRDGAYLDYNRDRPYPATPPNRHYFLAPADAVEHGRPAPPRASCSARRFLPVGRSILRGTHVHCARRARA
jgi:hypothetical protein